MKRHLSLKILSMALVALVSLQAKAWTKITCEHFSNGYGHIVLKKDARGRVFVSSRKPVEFLAPFIWGYSGYFLPAGPIPAKSVTLSPGAITVMLDLEPSSILPDRGCRLGEGGVRLIVGRYNTSVLSVRCGDIRNLADSFTISLKCPTDETPEPLM